MNISKHRELAVNAIKGVIKKNFIKRDTNDPILSNGVVKLESLLSRSKTENSSYDFKMGLHHLYKTGEFNDNLFKKILITLTAMANSGNESVGYVVIGVADTHKDASRFKSYYSSKTIEFKNFHITGIDEEAKKYPSLEVYRTKLEQKISKAEISPQYYKNQILRNIDLFNYYDKSVIILEIKAGDEPAEFEGKLFERQGTSTVEVPKDQKKQIWKNFL